MSDNNELLNGNLRELINQRISAELARAVHEQMEDEIINGIGSQKGLEPYKPGDVITIRKTGASQTQVQLKSVEPDPDDSYKMTFHFESISPDLSETAKT